MFFWDKYFSEIVQCVGKLICVTPEYDELKSKIGISSGETNEDKREDITAELNVYVAKLYELDDNELQYILDTFTQVEDSLKDKITKKWNSIQVWGFVPKITFLGVKSIKY